MNSTETKKQKTKKKKHQRNFFYDFVKVTGAIPALIWQRPKVYYPEGKKRLRGAALVCMNHLSFIDPILVHCVFWHRRLNCLATKELYNTKTKEWFFGKMHCIKVDRDNFSLDSFHAVTERLGEGKVVVIFPEGQINHEEHSVMTFKSGAVLMAHKSGAKLVPVYQVRRERWYQRKKVVVGAPIDIRAICGERPTIEELKSASETLRARELELMRYYDENILNKNKDKTSAEKEELTSERI